MTQTKRNDSSLQETQQVTHNSISPTLEVQPASDRITGISGALADIFADLSGVRIEPSDISTSFLEMGFDSLFLTQVTQALQNKFALRITFRQLLGDQSSLKSLAEFIDRQLPGDASAPKKRSADPEVVTNAQPSAKSFELPAQTTVPASQIGTTVDSALERLMREQMQAMNQLFAKQLEALQSASPAARMRNELPEPVAAPVAKVPVPDAPSQSQEPREFKPFGPYKPPQTPHKGRSSQLT
jgi:acyl carrier protein